MRAREVAKPCWVSVLVRLCFSCFNPACSDVNTHRGGSGVVPSASAHILQRLRCSCRLVRRRWSDGSMDILGHPGSIATHVDACSLLQPTPECMRLLQHPVLYVNLAVLVARERCIETREMPICLHGFKLITIEIVRRGASFAK